MYRASLKIEKTYNIEKKLDISSHYSPFCVIKFIIQSCFMEENENKYEK